MRNKDDKVSNEPGSCRNRFGKRRLIRHAPETMAVVSDVTGGGRSDYSNSFFFVVENSFSKKEELCVKEYEVVGRFVTCYVLCNEKGIFQAMFNYVI